jgi:hypothetical protein
LRDDEIAKKKIYQEILGKDLEQLDAPYLFEIIDFIVELTAPPPSDASENAKEGLAILAKQANELAERLAQTNIDRRFLTAINDYVGVLTDHRFSPIKVDLFSNRIRSYLVEMRDELPGFAIAEVSALLLSQERVLRQFPEWRTFERDASQFEPNEQTQQKQQELLQNLAIETRSESGIASRSVLDALERLKESSAETTLNNTAALGIWRSVENFLKTNIRYVIDAVKSAQSNLSRDQARYLRFLERLIPSLKLYVAMDERRAWLLPVIQWLEETLKAIKK